MIGGRRTKDRRQIEELIGKVSGVQRFWVAYSGGLDSQVLLHWMHCEIKNYPGISLNAIHINHQLSPHANMWQEHCQNVCQQLNIPLEVVTLNLVKNRGESLEAVARNARYEAFSHFLQEKDCLLTAHHQDDQAETVLLQLFRGAGPKGLSAMADVNSFAKGYIARPFLNYSREELVNYAKNNGLAWIEDESNQNQIFDRNYLRHKILPLIKERWPAASQCLSRSAKLCAQQEVLLRDSVQQKLDSVLQANNTLAVSSLCQFDIFFQAEIIRLLLRRNSITIPSEKKMLQILNSAITARWDANPIVKWQGGEIRRYRNSLYVFSNLQFPPNGTVLNWDMKNSLVLPNDCGTLVASKERGKNLIALDNSKISVKFNVKGLTCKIPGRVGTKSVNKLYQEWGVPTWERARVPLLFEGDRLITVVGYAVCEPCTTQNDQLGWKINLIPSPAKRERGI